MTDVLYILPHDRPWFWDKKRLSKRKAAYLPRVMFEVCSQIPPKYSIRTIDLNLELTEGRDIFDVISEVLQKENPKIVFLSFCVFTQGKQIEDITQVINKSIPKVPIVMGGAVINQIHDAPIRYFPCRATYNGFGNEISAILRRYLHKGSVAECTF